MWCLAGYHTPQGWPQMLWSKGIHVRLPYYQHFKQCHKVAKELLGPVQKFVK